jgi:hypothetical protein
MTVDEHDAYLSSSTMGSPRLRFDATVDVDTGKEVVYPTYHSPLKHETASQPEVREGQQGNRRGRRIAGFIPLWICACLVIVLLLALGLGIGLGFGLKKK